MDSEISQLGKKIQAESVFVHDLKKEIAKIIVGQEDLVNGLIVGLLANGHILVEGVPGLAKTLAVKTLAQTVSAAFQRIQFTPDLLPADIIGTMIFNPKDGAFSVKKGPVFTNILLADEINRAPAKVQSALLEAMQERQVTISDTTHRLPELFMVLATQNPIEQEGTYPLPEAQIDRFMLKINITYPSKTEESRILDTMARQHIPAPARVIQAEQILKARETADGIYVDDKIKNYVLDLVQATRVPEKYSLEKIKPWILYGASPRATIFLVQAAKAYAFIQGRGYVTPEDIKAVGLDVMRHRVLMTYEAEAENVNSETVLNTIFEAIEVP
ncbi:MAG: ATPase [Elusimicrobia bacterium GWA2_56_46]|nr:MAG: ATPase [Elusimicrobia bacterium GWA2_56_46]OGR54756.1 MAG: ATPase [Elusimicrobia bacterium GWC2_56_31]HBW23454.1 ATPase [Elusimicrobiota bacterium]